MKALRTLKALYSLARLVKDPSKLDEVFEMANALSTPDAMKVIVDGIRNLPGVQRALDERHRIHIDLDALLKLPKGTLGREFAEHMRKNNLDPSALPPLPSNDELEFFRAHLYETNDLWHVLTGFNTDVTVELGLQGFYAAQAPGPLVGLLLAVGLIRSGIYRHDALVPYMDAITHGYQMGKRAKTLFGVHWDELWSVPLEDVRSRFAIATEDTLASQSLLRAA